MAKEDQFKKALDMFFVGPLLIGLALGMYYSTANSMAIPVGVLGGLGVGFILRALVGLKYKK